MSSRDSRSDPKWPFPPPPSVHRARHHLPDAGKMIEPASEATPQGRPAAAPRGAPDGPDGPEDKKR